MAPLASEPRQMRVVLNLPKRKALYTLVVEITDWMRSQLILKNPNQQNQLNNNTSRQPHISGNHSLLGDLDDSHRQNGPPLPTRPSPGGGGPRSNLNSNFDSSDRINPLRNATLTHFDTWRTHLLTKLKDLLTPTDTSPEVSSRQERSARLARLKVDSPAPGENLIDFGDLLGPVAQEDGKTLALKQRQKEVEALQGRYHAIPTSLLTASQEDREEVVVCLLLLLLAGGKYVAESRTFLVYLCSALELPLSFLNGQEAEVATSLVESSKSPEAQQMSAAKEAEERKKANATGRMWKVGLASVAGAAIIGVTGGLAAPAVAGVIGGLMGSVGLGGVASFLGVFWMNGALVGTLFGALGAQMTGEMVDQYAREVEDFAFLPLSGGGTGTGSQNQERLRLTIGINGWLTESLSSLTDPWQALSPTSSNLFALRYEVAAMLNLGNALRAMVTSAAWTYIKVELLKRTVLATLWSALWPISLLSMASALDNPFSLAKNRSEKAGKILADALINRVQGERPVTLIGYSLGARVIYSCLRTLAERRAFGLVDEVILIGAPVPSDRDAWEMMRSVVSGKLWNVCSGNDYLLGFIYRTSSIQLGVAGLQEIKGIEGVENLDLTGTVKGHMRYPEILGKILEKCGVEIREGFGGEIEVEQDLTREEEIVLADMDAQGKIPAAPATSTKKGNHGGGLIDCGDDEQQHHDPPPRYAVMDPHASSSRPMMKQQQQGQAPPQPPRPQPQRTSMAKSTSSLQASSNNPLGNSGSSSSKPADDDFFTTQRTQPPIRSSTASSALSDLAALSISQIAAPSNPSKPSTPISPTYMASASTSKPSPSKAMNPHLLATLLLPSDQQQKPLGRSTTTSAGSDFSTVWDVPAIHRANTALPKPEIPRDIPVVSRPSLPQQSRSEPAPVDSDDSDDDTGGYGIKMVDNDSDGELEFAVPIPMEEDEGHGYGNWR
ncbi:hypothetical protein QBC32DRAFT_324953 [Pseudoneurospora amorphoporcata]|uniref:DUF726-domain-containing protein n=1 Tax=Pseudoneurospora amorphoporcata TaxID=241081 RepID=A0AAN6NTI8_9PEZI|nr:hypothetical protein QBC32DRAFT_324953 [Pseudoneurospora amorphoporcata]